MSPDTGLPERGYVTLDASGLPPLARVFVGQCATGTSTCDTSWWITGQGEVYTDAAGDLVSHTFAVRRVLGGGTDCASAPGCVLRVSDSRTVVAEASLSFAGPPGPPKPMTLSVTPTTGLADGQVVQVHGSFFMPGGGEIVEQCGGSVCQWPIVDVDVGADGSFTIALTVHSIVRNDGGNSFDCRAHGCTIGTGQTGVTPVPIAFAA